MRKFVADNFRVIRHHYAINDHLVSRQSRAGADDAANDGSAGGDPCTVQNNRIMHLSRWIDQGGVLDDREPGPAIFGEGVGRERAAERLSVTVLNRADVVANR